MFHKLRDNKGHKVDLGRSVRVKLVAKLIWRVGLQVERFHIPQTVV